MNVRRCVLCIVPFSVIIAFQNEKQFDTIVDVLSIVRGGKKKIYDVVLFNFFKWIYFTVQHFLSFTFHSTSGIFITQSLCTDAYNCASSYMNRLAVHSEQHWLVWKKRFVLQRVIWNSTQMILDIVIPEINWKLLPSMFDFLVCFAICNSHLGNRTHACKQIWIRLRTQTQSPK